jgi:hypothetical protein
VDQVAIRGENHRRKAAVLSDHFTAKWSVLEQDVQSILYEWSISNYSWNEDQREIARIFVGPYTIWRFAVTVARTPCAAASAPHRTGGCHATIMRSDPV